MPAFPWPGRLQLESSHQTVLMQRLNAGSAIASAWIILLMIHAEPSIPVCRSLERAQDQEARARPSKGRERHAQLADRAIPADGNAEPGARKVRACDVNRLPALSLTRCTPALSNPLARMAIAALLAPGLSGCGGEGGQSVGEVIDDVRVVEIVDEGTVVEVMDKVNVGLRHPLAQQSNGRGPARSLE